MLKIFSILMAITSLVIAQDKFKDAAYCGECHKEIYRDWLTSMHAQSTVQRDPLFRGMYELAIKESKGKLESKCIVCHSPMSTVFKNIDRETAFNRDGITCQFCHGAEEVGNFHSAKNIKINLDNIYSYQPDQANSAHLTSHRDYYNKSEICLPCHNAMKNPRELEVCSTGNEWRSYYEKYQKSCQNCHMPRINDMVSHQFIGTHQNNLLGSVVDMKLEYENESRELQITLLNNGAGHALPTGTPLRMIYLKVTAFDSSGEILWQNWKQNPVKEDKSALFMKIFADDAGNAPVPPWRATQIVYERYLMPDEPTTVKYIIDQDKIYDIETNLYYRFASPQILEKFKIKDPHFTEARLIVQRGMKIVE